MTTPVPHLQPPEEDAPARGRLLAGRYRLGRRIGAGGMATILRASDTQMDRQVAVKVLHAHLADDAEVRRRFAGEARHAASLTHPHVVAVFDQGEADLPYIVLELVDGPSLREVLATHGPLTPAQVLTVLAPLCDALDAAHRIGLIHRDVKPENVLVTEEGTPKLADFGIARVMAATSHTATGTLVGSVHYLAPELVDGVEATPASDQYALAVVAYELLTGRKPLPADTPMAIALRHASEPIPPPSRYAPEVPPGLDAVIARATAHDPAQRYPSLTDMAAAMRAAVEDPPAAVTHLADDGVVKTLVLPGEFADTSTLSDGPSAAEAAAELAARRQRTPSATERARGRLREWRRRWGRRVALGLLVVVTLGLLTAGGVFAWTTFLAPTTEVVEVLGLEQGEALASLDEAGLAMQIVDEEHRLDIPAGQVIGQEPAPGTEVREGETVFVVLSLGPRVVEMPSLVGETYEDIVPLLQADAFDVSLAQQHHDTAPQGTVIAQLPDPGERVEQGSQVDVMVSLGIEQVDVPPLAGLTVEQAQQRLEGPRLTLETTEEWSDEVPDPGVIIRQEVEAGTTVDALSTVPVVVSRGPLTIEVPDLRGLSVDEARAVVGGLEEIRLVEETGPVPTLGPFTLGSAGRVEQQLPEPGSEIQRGESIQIYYFE